MLLAQAKTEEQRKAVEEKLKKEKLEKKAAQKAQSILQKKLKSMEQKLLMGGTDFNTHSLTSTLSIFDFNTLL